MIGRPRFRFTHLARVAKAAALATTATMMFSVVVPAAAVAASEEVPASCPVTLPSEPALIPPGRYPETPPGRPHAFWYGTPGLWTMLPSNGIFTGIASPSPGLPGEVATRNKSFWWSPGFHPRATPDPQLKVEARRLNGEGPAYKQPWITNAHAPEFGGWTMLYMLDLPTVGCWEVTTSYGSDRVSYVVWVAAPQPGSLKPHYLRTRR